MTGQEVTVEQLLRSIRDDWELAQTIRRKLGARLAHVKRLGVPGSARCPSLVPATVGVGTRLPPW